MPAVWKSPQTVRARAAALAMGASALLWDHPAQAANTEYDVTNGQTNLTAAATYTTGGTAGTGAGGITAAAGPTVTSDVTFDSGTAYSPAAFFLNSSRTFGSLNDLSATALTINNPSGPADTLTLGGSGDPGSSVPGAATGDLLYVAAGGSLTIGAASSSALGLVLAQAGNLNIVGTAAVNSVITGTSGLTMTGAGTLTLSGANTYTGATTISAGTVLVGVAQNGAASGVFGTGSSALTLGSGATLNLQGDAVTVGAVTASAGSSTLTSTNAATLTINAGSNLSTLTVTGAASLLLTGSTGKVLTTPSGTLIAGTGSLGFANDTSLGAGGGIRENALAANLGASGALLFNGSGGLQTITANTLTTGNGVIVNGTNNYWNFQAAIITTGAWTGSGTINLNQGGTPMFTFAGNMTGFGGTLQLVLAGQANTVTFALSNGVFVGGAAAVWNQRITGAAGATAGTNTLEWAGAVNSTIPFGDLNTTGAAIVAGGGTIQLENATTGTTATFQVGALNASDTYAGTIIDGTGTTAITKVGTGTWTLTGVNTYTGATTVSNGTLALGVANTLTATSGITVGPGTLSLAAANALATPGATTSTTMGSPVSVAGQVPITLGGGTLLRNGTGVSLGSQSGTAGTVGIGLLTLTAASTINYGTTGVGTLNFNGLAGASSTNTLSIINYTTTEPPGTVGVDGTDDRLIFNQDVAGFLPDITIDGKATMEVALGNGEFSVVTAVPEPSTWTAMLASVGLLGFCLRRKRHLAAKAPFPLFVLEEGR